jgi:hypothetical protein
MMIDFSRIEETVAGLLLGLTDFRSTETGRVRETVPVAAMPALDVSATGHKTTYDANIHYSVSVVAVIRRKGFDRTDNANEFKDLIEQTCALLEMATGDQWFDCITDLSSETGEEAEGSGALIRVGVIRVTALKD